MDEYIKREQAIKIAEYYGLKNGSALGRHSGIADCIAEAIFIIPSADVAPVRHGRWDENGRCTSCGGHAPFWSMSSTYYESPYCFECVAKMDGGAE